jgi:hypothetical protein
MVRKPKFANEWQLWYFASKDAGVAHTLARRFFWSENILWKEDIAEYKATVFLSEKDLIMDTSHIRAYLLGHEERSDKLEHHDARKLINTSKVTGPKTGEVPSVVWCTGLDHGQIFDGGAWRARLVGEVLRRVSQESQKPPVSANSVMPRRVL